MGFDDEEKRDDVSSLFSDSKTGADEPVVKWDDHEWGKPSAFSTPSTPAPLPPPPMVQPIEVERAASPRSKKSKRARRDHAPSVEPTEEERDWHSGAQPGTAGAQADGETAVAATGPLVGRGLLMLIAAGYLFWMAALCYGSLGELHRQAGSASGARLHELQKTHEKIATLTFANAGGGGLFALAGILLLAGRRGFGKTLVFFGSAFLIAFIYLHYKHAQPYLRDLDLLNKLIILSLASLSIRR